jgi:ABC-2 type transport system permease protein
MPAGRLRRPSPLARVRALNPEQISMHQAFPPSPRPIGAVNWIGVWTLYRKEVRRFIKVYMQTMVAPVATTLLFFTVFALALGGVVRMVGDVPFLHFLAPGLIIMTMAQNAFANTSSSVVISKVQGNIVDVLMPPLSPLELASAYVMAGVTRGVFVGAVTAAAIMIVVPITIQHPAFALLHGVLGSMMLALLGAIGGIWSEKFDHIAAVTNFVVTPLTFLSGTFYTIDRLPEGWRFAAHLNPFFYMIDGFRYGFIGQSDGTLGLGLAVMIGTNAILWAVCLRMLATGYKLKS